MMKLGSITRLALLAGVLAFTACQKKVAEVAPEPEPATPVPVATPPPATPVAVVATPVPEPLAPPGVFYLLQPASITTEDGIVGLKPGRQLQQVSPGSYTVDGHTIQLRDTQVTNNLRIAGQFAAAAASAQAAIRANLQQTAAREAAVAAQVNAIEQKSASAAAASRAPAISPGLNRQASGLDASNSLGAAHTKTQGGWLWQKSSDGSWQPVRQLGK